MKRNEINVGGLYTARVNDKLVTVRVDAIRETVKHGGYDYGGKPKMQDAVVYDVTNLTTGRTTTFRSAAKFRAAVQPEGKQSADPTPASVASAPSVKVTPTATTSALTTVPASSTPTATLLPECPSCEGEDTRLDGDSHALCRGCGYRWYYRAPQPVAVLAPLAYCTGEEPDCCEGGDTGEVCPACGKVIAPAPVFPSMETTVVEVTPEAAEEMLNPPHLWRTKGKAGRKVSQRMAERYADDIVAGNYLLSSDDPTAPAVEITPGEAEELLRPEATADRLLLEERSVAEGKQGADPTRSILDTTGGSQPSTATRSSSNGSIAGVEPVTPPAPPDSQGDTVRPRTAATSLSGSALAAKLRERRAIPTETVPHLLIEARAGTGKTTTLIEGLKRIKGVPSEHPAARDPMPQQLAIWEAMSAGPAPRTIAFVAFNKSIASELQSRVPEGCEASTMHSMGFKAVNRAFSGLKVNNYNVQDIIAHLIGQDIRDLRKESPVVLKATEELVGLCKVNLVPIDGGSEAPEVNRLLGGLADYYDVDLASDSGRSYREEIFSLVPRVLDACRNPVAQGAIDFNDMIWLPVVLDLPVFRFDLLLVDEAQDLNLCQQALAKKAGKRLVLCGDPKQAIYGFAGADARSMVRMEEDLAATPAGCEHLYLTVTRRCGKAIVDEARQVVADFSAHDSNGSGKVSEAKYPLQGPRNERKEIPYEQTYMPSVADGDFILCRTNAPLVSQCFRFIRRGHKATIQGRDIGQGLISTIQKQKAGSVRELIEKLSKWYEGEESKERAKRNPSEARLLALSDRYDCLMCFCGDLPSEAPISAVEAKINAIFTDDKNVKGVRLSSVHKAKGLEAQRVFFLNIPEGPCPHPMAESDWEREQEQHIWYVGVTRAIEELVWVR